MTALHGFLGLPSDWAPVFPADEFGEVHAAAWGPLLKEGPQVGALPALADELNKRAREDSTLIGYSMGGRIALHMLIQGGRERWQRAVIVSASPGLKTETDRDARVALDRHWAHRFRQEPWANILAAWEAQPMFRGEPRPPREEKDFAIGDLACALERGSVGLQKDLRPLLSDLQIPVLWIAGARDVKYAALAEECADLNALFEVRILEEAGHRVPWSRTEQFRKIVKEWIA